MVTVNVRDQFDYHRKWRTVLLPWKKGQIPHRKIPARRKPQTKINQDSSQNKFIWYQSISSVHHFKIFRWCTIFYLEKKKSPSRSLRSPHTIRARPACEDCVVFSLLIPPRKYSAQHYKKFSPTGSGAYLFSHFLTTSTPSNIFPVPMTQNSAQSHTQTFFILSTRDSLFLTFGYSSQQVTNIHLPLY
jgi:hypothetical protein